jgi:hypothetical protein
MTPPLPEPDPKRDREPSKAHLETTATETTEVWLRKWTAALSPIATLVAAIIAIYFAAIPQRMQETSQQQLRAYVVVDAVEVEKIEVGELLISFKATNAGQTPAYDLITEIAIELGDYPLVRDIAMHAILQPPGPYFMKTIEPREIRSNYFSPDDIEEILAASTRRLYVVARSTYLDIFKKERRTNFCFMYAKTRTGSYQFIRCEPLAGARLNFAD